MADSNNDELIAFTAGRFEVMADRLNTIEQEMATKEDLAKPEGRFSERFASLDGRLSERIEVATTSIRGDIEQIHLRLDSKEHRFASREEHVTRRSPACAVLSTSSAKIVRMCCGFSATKAPKRKLVTG